MAMTLVEASKRSNDVLQKGIIELLVKNDPLLEKLQFKDIKGNGLTYDREATLSGAQFYNVGEEWVESTSTVTQATAHTKILGGDADVDEYLATTRSNIQDLMGEQIQAKTKAIKRAFTEAAIYGDADNEPKMFDGLHSLIADTTYNALGHTTTSGTPLALALSAVERAMDFIKDGAPDLILMTKTMRRHINVFLNGVGGLTKGQVEGKWVQTIDDVPIAVSDWLSDDESCDKTLMANEAGTTAYGHNDADGTGLADDDDATTLFFLQFAPTAFCGIQSGGPLRVKRFRDELESKNAKRVRLVWYPGVMMQSLISCTKLSGVDPAGTVTA